MNKRIIFSAIVLLVSLNGFSQDPLFANTQQSLVYLNPSFAGSNGFIRNQFAYRNQWPELSGNYVTYLNSFDMYLKPLKGGFHFSSVHDDQAHGTLMTDVFSLGYAQHFSFNDGKLKIIPSLQTSFGVKRLDRSKLTFGENIDPRRGFVWNEPTAAPSARKTYFDLSSGLLVNYKHFYFGATAFHINQPDEGLSGASKLPLRFGFHASYNFNISENVLMNVFGMYEQQQKFSFYQFSTNVLLYKHIIIGAGYRYSLMPIANIGYRHNYFTVQAGYGITNSIASNITYSSWELAASFNLRNKDNRKLVTDFEKW